MPVRHPLQDIKTFPSLVKYLRDELDWPIESSNFDDLTFEFEPEELGLKDELADKIGESKIKQLRPFVTNQPWGIFFIDFKPKRLPVVALRKILGNLVFKKRKSANKSERAAWQLHDLLFISAFGDDDDRQITLAHFSEGAGGHDIPTLKVMGWDELDTRLNLQQVDRDLHLRLRWPEKPANLDAWRKQWSAAFILRHREVITTAQELAAKLALLAKAIRVKVTHVLDIETESGPLRKLYTGFKKALIHDLSEDDFGDMYSQTITYGLFSAAVSRTTPNAGTAVIAENLTDMVPVTNPFLREMLSKFLTVGGRKGALDFDELGIQEVVEVLNSSDTNLAAVVRNFGDRRHGEDPVIHFYEDFLKQYDRQRKVERGVFYTPQPVVSYIVRSVHELLQTEFGLEDGLASTVTWGEMVAMQPAIQLPKETKPTDPFVVILDPATGTATFLVEVIDVIHRTLTQKWNRQKLTAVQQIEAWNQYVPNHLLPRLFGYELMMAPYAIAHMKIGLKLGETGYRFASNERARIYLTNTLEPASDHAANAAANLFEALGHEAQAVNAVKRHQRFTVVLGNPPYAGISSNMSEHAQQIVDAYKIVDGEALNERKLWLQDDYVKFIREAQSTIQRTHVGIVGYITPHGYLDNPTFRGMRQSLLKTFQNLRVLDLHGNANKKERSPDGSKDENVFDIRQGVAIGIFSRLTSKAISTGQVARSDMWGLEAQKYGWLTEHSVNSTQWSDPSPTSPFYLFAFQAQEYRVEYEQGWKITDVMPMNSTGFITARDHFVIDFDENELSKRMLAFTDPRLSDAEIRHRYFAGKGSDKYPDGDTRGWKLSDARKTVQKDGSNQTRIRRCLYRPFDERFVYWAPWMIDWPRPEVMDQMVAGNNVALITSRMTKGESFAHAQVTRNISEVICMSAKTSNNGFVFPLWRRDKVQELLRALGRKTQESQTVSRYANFSPAFLGAIADRMHLQRSGVHDPPTGITPEEIFHYIYALFHSPTYRSRYAEFLKIDFPRLPLTGDLELFHALARLGGELVAAHLMETSKVDHSRTVFVGSQDSEVEKTSWSRHTVWVNKAQTVGFKGVPEVVWTFHIGGYQVCEKWLKDRKGRTLTPEDINHFQKIVVALAETIRLMAEIDQVIDQHGGWPDAFAAKVDE